MNSQKCQDCNGITEKCMKCLLSTARQEGRSEAIKEIFDMFDEYSCIKDDKWYLDLKAKLKEVRK